MEYYATGLDATQDADKAGSFLKKLNFFKLSSMHEI